MSGTPCLSVVSGQWSVAGFSGHERIFRVFLAASRRAGVLAIQSYQTHMVSDRVSSLFGRTWQHSGQKRVFVVSGQFALSVVSYGIGRIGHALHSRLEPAGATQFEFVSGQFEFQWPETRLESRCLLAKMQPGLVLFGFCPEGTKQISPEHRPRRPRGMHWL